MQDARHQNSPGSFLSHLLVLVALCLTWSAGVQAETPPAVQAHPRIVPQQMQSSLGFAAWTPDDRFVVTREAGLLNGIQVWEVRTGILVNTIPMPQVDARFVLAPSTATVDASGRLTLTGLLAEFNTRLCGEGERCVCRKLSMTIPLRQAGAWQITADDQISVCPGTAADGQIATSHNGQFILDATDYPARIKDRQGKVIRELNLPEPVVSFAAALSPDGKRLALLNDDSKESGPRFSILKVFDLAVSKVTMQKRFAGFYTKVSWLDDERIILPGDTSGGRMNEPVTAETLTRIFKVSSAADQDVGIPLRCNTLVLGDGTLIGSGIGNCRYPGTPGQGLERFDQQRGWQPFGATGLAGAYIDDMTLTPDRRTLVTAAVSSIGDVWTLQAIDAVTGSIRGEVTLPAGAKYPYISQTPDSRSVVLTYGERNYRWDLSNAAPVALAPTEMPGTLLAMATVSRDGLSWYERPGDPLGTVITAVSVAGGVRRERTQYWEIMGEGAVPNSPLRWVVTGNDGIVLWQPDRANPLADPEVARINLFEGDHFFALAPDGRYDTDLGPETKSFRWLVSDAPLQSLAPQTFMRDYFEPRLVPRLMACTATRSCAKTLRAIPALAGLNRVQPEVRILRVASGTRPDESAVDVEVSRGRNPDVPNGKTQSDAYDLRLFRDGSLVAQWPGEPDDGKPFELGQWRNDNHIAPGPDGTAFKRFKVRLPSGGDPVEFTAYAFNEDRVKSETARMTDTFRPVVKRQGRVYVIALGVDNYTEKHLRLNFAAGDAQLLGSRLAGIPGARDVRLVVVADSDRPGSPHLTKRAMGDIFALLGGAPRAAALARLKALGIDASMLDPATPDDTVIITFSGHGWADPQGNFYLVPADARWPDETQPPDVTSLVSSAEMSRQMRQIDAGEMALIIDACHSAASVDAKDFRAGPMGDPGLGQLAYDKRMRVLAATQADDVALESDKLGQGLLTYALAAEGITADGGLADQDKDGAITLDEWLRYATARLPALSRDAKLARRIGGADGKARGVVFLDGDQPQRPVQEPSLFDFTGKPSKLVLRRVKP